MKKKWRKWMEELWGKRSGIKKVEKEKETSSAVCFSRISTAALARIWAAVVLARMAANFLVFTVGESDIFFFFSFWSFFLCSWKGNGQCSFSFFSYSLFSSGSRSFGRRGRMGRWVLTLVKGQDQRRQREKKREREKESKSEKNFFFFNSGPHSDQDKLDLRRSSSSASIPFPSFPLYNFRASIVKEQHLDFTENAVKELVSALSFGKGAAGRTGFTTFGVQIQD